MNAFELLQLEQQSYERARDASNASHSILLDGFMQAFGYDLEQDEFYTRISDDYPNHIQIEYVLRGAASAVVNVPAPVTTTPEDVADWIRANVMKGTVAEMRMLANVTNAEGRVKMYEGYLRTAQEDLDALLKMQAKVQGEL